MSRIVSPPGDAPVRLDLEDGRIICVVELDLWVPQLGRVDVHHDWSCARGLSRRGHAHNLLVAAPDGRRTAAERGKERRGGGGDLEWDLYLSLDEGYETELYPLNYSCAHTRNGDKAAHTEHLSVSPPVVSSA